MTTLPTNCTMVLKVTVVTETAFACRIPSAAQTLPSFLVSITVWRTPFCFPLFLRHLLLSNLQQVSVLGNLVGEPPRSIRLGSLHAVEVLVICINSAPIKHSC